MTIELNGELANDRFGTPGGSIYFKYGYGSVAPGVYFDPATGGFTVMAWMKFVSISNHMRLIDFALNFDNNNVFVQIYSNKESEAWEPEMLHYYLFDTYLRKLNIGNLSEQKNHW